MARKLSRKAAFTEVFEYEPKIVAKTRRKKGKGRARKQKIAIALSKAGLSRKRRKFTPGETKF